MKLQQDNLIYQDKDIAIFAKPFQQILLRTSQGYFTNIAHSRKDTIIKADIIWWDDKGFKLSKEEWKIALPYETAYQYDNNNTLIAIWKWNGRSFEFNEPDRNK